MDIFIRERSEAFVRVYQCVGQVEAIFVEVASKKKKP